MSCETRTLQKPTEKLALLIRLFTFKLQPAQKVQNARNTKVALSATLGIQIEIENGCPNLGF
jgi:hypothetical protein